MVTTRVYKSTDASAPTLKGNVLDPNTDGSLANLLNNVLVTGYGASVAAGWSRPFTSTNRAAFQQGAGSNGFYLRVNENIGSVSYASVRGYEDMATIDTSNLPNNQGMFSQPTQGPLPSSTGRGTAFVKSTSFDATARPWMVIANERFFYMWVNSQGTTFTTLSRPTMFCFGDIDPVMPNSGDNYNTILIGSSNGSPEGSFIVVPSDKMNFVQVALYMARPYSQLPGSTPLQLMYDAPYQLTGVFAPGGVYNSIVFPNPVNNKMYLTKIGVYEFSQGGAAKPALRGYMPGMYAPLHLLNNSTTLVTGISDGSILTPSAAPLVGKTFTAKQFGTVNGQGSAFFETSNTWTYAY